jgi:hypothetical protein
VSRQESPPHGRTPSPTQRAYSWRRRRLGLRNRGSARRAACPAWRAHVRPRCMRLDRCGLVFGAGHDARPVRPSGHGTHLCRRQAPRRAQRDAIGERIGRRRMQGGGLDEVSGEAVAGAWGPGADPPLDDDASSVHSDASSSDLSAHAVGLSLLCIPRPVCRLRLLSATH